MPLLQTPIPPPADASPNDTLFEALVKSVIDHAIYMLDPQGRIVSWNSGAQRLKGFRSEEIIGRHFSVLYTAEDQDSGTAMHGLEIALEMGKFESQGWRVRGDGSRFWASVVIEPAVSATGSLLGFVKITRDLTERKRQDDEMEATRHTLDLALSHMSHGLCLFDAGERLVLCNPRVREMMEMGNTAPTGMPFRTFLRFLSPERGSIAPLYRRARADHRQAMLMPGGTITREFIRRGRTILIRHRALPEGGWVSTYDDITERRLAEDRVSHLAHHDILTGLPNRACFLQRIDAAIAGQERFSLLFIDLDGFKPINDRLGHGIGDEALRQVAARILRCIPEPHVPARLGGDEFAVLQLGLDESAAGELSRRLLDEIGRPLPIGTHEIRVGASIGIALSPEHGRSTDLLLRRADLALYAAKLAGRGRWLVYTPDMDTEQRRRHALEHDLHLALTRDEFSLHYQPILHTGRNSVSGFEALLRWSSPDRGEVPPVLFIPFAEEIGLMPTIGEWVLRTACREAAGWPEPLSVSVNLSPKQFRQPGLIGLIQGILAETGLAPGRLELEITETAMIEDIVGTAGILDRLKAVGIGIALDDFGTGYSSLSFLHSLPFNRIKIDRSFIRDLGVKPAAAAIVRAVTGLCISLGVSVTAEGVETEEQAAILAAERCDEIQGYLVGRPSPPARIPGLLAAPRR